MPCDQKMHVNTKLCCSPFQSFQSGTDIGNTVFVRFSHILSDMVEDVVGGMPTLLRHMLRLLFAESDFHFAVSGAIVPTEAREEAHFVATFNSFVLDEKACHINF